MENIKKKWIVKKLNKKLKFTKAAKLIINKKLEELFLEINLFLADDSVENLHDVRIAIRRVRYILEVFYLCFLKEDLLKLYQLLKDLQDLIGEARDLDVIMEKLKFIETTYSSQVPEVLYSNMLEKRKLISRQITESLNDFKKLDIINKFLKKKTGDT